VGDSPASMHIVKAAFDAFDNCQFAFNEIRYGFTCEI
jgi:hypothetical protein